MSTYHGQCHCGRIAWEVDGDIPRVVECNCSLCRRRGHLMWFVARSDVRLLTPEADIATYTFGSATVRHQFCAHCGCGTFGAATDPAGVERLAINVRCLDGVDLDALEVAHYDGASV